MYIIQYYDTKESKVLTNALKPPMDFPQTLGGI